MVNLLFARLYGNTHAKKMGPTGFDSDKDYEYGSNTADTQV
jgi:hypothetical protein